jgi:hypothetical protein
LTEGPAIRRLKEVETDIDDLSIIQDEGIDLPVKVYVRRQRSSSGGVKKCEICYEFPDAGPGDVSKRCYSVPCDLVLKTN